MDLVGRLLLTFLIALGSKKRYHVLDPIELELRAHLGDRGPDGHLKSARLQSFCDIAMIDFFVRTGVFKVIRKNGWMPVVRAKKVVFNSVFPARTPLRIKTSLIGWDDRHSFFEHQVSDQDQNEAVCITVGRMIDPKKKGPLNHLLLDEMGLNADKLDNIPAGLQQLVE